MFLIATGDPLIKGPEKLWYRWPKQDVYNLNQKESATKRTTTAWTNNFRRIIYKSEKCESPSAELTSEHKEIDCDISQFTNIN